MRNELLKAVAIESVPPVPIPPEKLVKPVEEPTRAEIILPYELANVKVSIFAPPIIRVLLVTFKLAIVEDAMVVVAKVEVPVKAEVPEIARVPVAVRFTKPAVPVKSGESENTATPDPVLSVIEFKRFAEVIEEVAVPYNVPLAGKVTLVFAVVVRTKLWLPLRVKKVPDI